MGVNSQNIFCSIGSFDHIVLTVKDLHNTVTFYTDVMNMNLETYIAKNDNTERISVTFGNQKINIHSYDNPHKEHAKIPTPGSADLCFLSNNSVQDWIKYLNLKGIHIVDGPVKRNGANGEILSIYIRDPDGNLIEIAEEI
ncbi:MAG: VOC family virulence protein [Chloroflexi bacterium]|nr:VOC family virulence protein [Chloroflexota bacterium]